MADNHELLVQRDSDFTPPAPQAPSVVTVTIQPWGPFTSNDRFNLFNLTVMEF